MSAGSFDPTNATAITFVNVFPVWDEAVREHFVTFGRSSASRTMVCYWQDRIPIINNIFSIGGLNVSQQPYYGPALSYSSAPFLLYLDNVEVEGIAGPNGLNVDPNGTVGYFYARLKLNYLSFPYDQDNLNIVSVDSEVEDLNIPGRSFYYNGDTSTPVSDDVFPSLRVPTCTITIQQFNQLSIPLSVSNPLLGKVNSSTVFGCAPQTLMFYRNRSNRRIAVSGVTNYDMTYQFLFQPYGWNNKYQSGFGFVPVKDANGNPPYTLDSNNFGGLGIYNSQGLL